MHTAQTFVETFKDLTGRFPTAGDWYYHEECRNAGASCSVHQTDENPPRYLQVPTDGGAATIHAADIRGQDR